MDLFDCPSKFNNFSAVLYDKYCSWRYIYKQNIHACELCV